jgi:Tfp pilus assembly protein PilE
LEKFEMPIQHHGTNTSTLAVEDLLISDGSEIQPQSLEAEDSSCLLRLASDERAFTIIELLSVSVIIAALSAISIYQYSSYKSRSYDLHALSALRNGVTGANTFFDDNETYPACTGAACSTMIDGLSQDSQVGINYIGVNGGDEFMATTCHTDGKTVYTFASTVGLILETPTASCAGS